MWWKPLLAEVNVSPPSLLICTPSRSVPMISFWGFFLSMIIALMIQSPGVTRLKSFSLTVFHKPLVVPAYRMSGFVGSMRISCVRRKTFGMLLYFTHSVPPFKL